MPFRHRDPRLLNVSIGSLILLVILVLWAGQNVKCQEAAPAPTPSKRFVVTIGGYVSLAGIDAGLTAGCLSLARCAETNPVLRPMANRPGALAATKMATSGALALSVWKLHLRHSKVAWWLLIGSTAMQGVIDVRNLRAMRTVVR